MVKKRKHRMEQLLMVWAGSAFFEQGRRARAVPICCKILTFAETLTVCGIAVREYLAFSHSQSLK